MSDWIRTAEMLPERETLVLVWATWPFSGYAGPDVMRLVEMNPGARWWERLDGGPTTAMITHWMHLPGAPL